LGEQADTIQTAGMSEGRRALRNYLLNFGAASFDAVSAIVVIAVLARALSLEDFGRYSFIIAFTAISRFLAGMGIPIIVTREIARQPEATPQIYASAFVLHVCLAAGYIVLITGTVALLHYSREVVLSTALCAAGINADFFARLFGAVFKGFERMEYEAITTCVSRAAYLAGILYVVRFWPGLVAIFAATLAASVVDAALGYFFLVRRFVRPRLSGNCGMWRHMLKEAYPVGLRRILRLISYRVDTLLLVAMKGNVEAGLFHAVYKVVNGFTYIAEAMVQAVYPMLSRKGLAGDSHATYGLTLKYLIVLSLPLVIAFWLFPEPIIRITLGAKFLPAAWTMRFLGVSLVMLFLTTLMERTLIAHDRQRASSIMTAISVVALVALDVALIPSMGAVGAAIATLVAETVLLVIYHFYIARDVSPGDLFGAAVRPTVAAALSGLTAYWLLPSGVPLAAGAATAVYLAGLLILGTFSMSELAVVKESAWRRSRRLAVTRRG
jgi:O-antigen/teichoic acid export membrane protein